MYRASKHFRVTALSIAEAMKAPIYGKSELVINSVGNLSEANDGMLLFVLPEYASLLKSIANEVVVVCTPDMVTSHPMITFIAVDNPKLEFFKYVNDFIIEEVSNREYYENNKAFDVTLSNGGRIGNNVTMHSETVIGSNCRIGNNVVIRAGVTIGNNVIIKDNSVIGSEGMGYILNGEELMHIPQIGKVVLEDNVVIGSCSTVEKPALGETRIKSGVKVDDLVQIGHNCVIGRNTFIAAGAKMAGGVRVGSGCFLGMNSIILSKKVSVGNNVIIGAGAVVTKSVSDDLVYYSKVESKVKPLGDQMEPHTGYNPSKKGK